MAQDPRGSYASFRPDLSEARLLSIAHQKAVELHAAQQTAHVDPPLVRFSCLTAYTLPFVHSIPSYKMPVAFANPKTKYLAVECLDGYQSGDPCTALHVQTGPAHDCCASQHEQHVVAKQANGVVDPELPASSPPPRPRRSSYASYAQPLVQSAADGDKGTLREPAPYTSWVSSSISADNSPGGVPPWRPSSGGRSQQAASATTETAGSGGFGAQPGHVDAQHAGANGSGGPWSTVADPLPGYTRAGTALGKAGFQVCSVSMVTLQPNLL